MLSLLSLLAGAARAQSACAVVADRLQVAGNAVRWPCNLYRAVWLSHPARSGCVACTFQLAACWLICIRLRAFDSRIVLTLLIIHRLPPSFRWLLLIPNRDCRGRLVTSTQRPEPYNRRDSRKVPSLSRCNCCSLFDPHFRDCVHCISSATVARCWTPTFGTACTDSVPDDRN
jgi:hypothetical protein